MEKHRNTSFEAMRLLAMFMVILGHCVLVTAQDKEPYLGGLDNIGWGIKAFTVCAVNLFFLLSGFYLKAENFKLGRILRIWMKTVFYSIVIYLVVSIISSSFSIRDAITYCFPILMKKYWFMQTYIVTALISPFVGIALERVTERNLNYLVVVLLCFFCIHETFVKVGYTLDSSSGYGIIWALVMMVIGFWIKVNGRRLSCIPAGLYLLAYVVLSGCIFLSNILIVKYGIADGVTSRGNFYAYNSVTVLLQSISLFCFFLKLASRERYVKGINALARNTLADYLISAHPLLLSSIWLYVFPMERFVSKLPVYILLSVLFSALTLIVCIGIDKVLEFILRGARISDPLGKFDRMVQFKK